MNFSELEGKLPDLSIVWNGFGTPLQVNANLVTGDAVTVESSPVEFIVKLLAAMFALQQEKNVERAAENKEPIEFIDRAVSLTTDEKLRTVFTVMVESDIQAALNNPIDPTVDEE